MLFAPLTPFCSCGSTTIVLGLLSLHPPASIALAATLGMPVCIITEASAPMVAALIHGGLGLGPAMAFLVTGAGTSIGAMTGAFARARIIALVVALLFTGALALGAPVNLTGPDISRRGAADGPAPRRAGEPLMLRA